MLRDPERERAVVDPLERIETPGERRVRPVESAQRLERHARITGVASQ
jgi:hypothetical protein